MTSPSIVVTDVVDNISYAVNVAEWEGVNNSVEQALDAFSSLQSIEYSSIEAFYRRVMERLLDREIQEEVLLSNVEDSKKARARGRPTGRLSITNSDFSLMAEGVQAWIDQGDLCDRVLESQIHEGWRVDLITAPLGCIGFVFEGRPNVLIDALGVLTGKNTTVLRIGSDALGTARALYNLIIEPSLSEVGIHKDVIIILDSPSRDSALALCAQSRLALMVIRGSGEAVKTLGGIARCHGIPLSLHGTGGAWMILSSDVSEERVLSSIVHSLDRKVCNTLNTIVVSRGQSSSQVELLVRAFNLLVKTRGSVKIHGPSRILSLFENTVTQRSPRVLLQEADDLAISREFEWEDVPEVAITDAESLHEAAQLFNKHSSQFVVTLISRDEKEHSQFFHLVNAPFVGNGFTRWVDGQYALLRPELGLSNWQHGRLLGRSGFLSATSLFTVRACMKQDSLNVKR
jgi:glutamate-5-semialdehyde dehydrogenase